MGFKIISTFEDMIGNKDMDTVKCTICGYTTVIYSNQDYPCDCPGCLGRQHADE